MPASPRSLAEQTILVTGSSNGHGRRLAQELAARGADVVAHGRDRERTEAAAREIGARRALVADLSSLDEVRGLAVPASPRSPLGERHVTVTALHSATFMDTKMVRGALGRPRSSVEEGVEATLRLVADPELDGVSGVFFDGLRESASHPQAHDPEARRRLWELSEELAGVRVPT